MGTTLETLDSSIDAVFRALASAPGREILRMLSEAEENEHWAEESFGEKAGYYGARAAALPRCVPAASRTRSTSRRPPFRITCIASSTLDS
jgi:hypothetical protein